MAFQLRKKPLRNTFQRKQRMKKTFLILILVAITGSQADGWRRTTHLIGVPFIAGSGIYADVKMLQDADHTSTKAAAITNLSLLAAQASLGSLMLFGIDDSPVVRILHRVVGISLIASGVWISTAGTLDRGVEKPTRIAAYGHTGLAAVPLIIFSF